MRTITAKLMLLLVPLFLFLTPISSLAYDKGIYINQSTLENSKKLNYLIKRSKQHGIKTFIVDLEKVTPRYKKHINLIKSNNIRYVARIVVFPHGGTADQIRSKAHWSKKYKLAKTALDFGADEIQLDYIRFKPTQKPSAKNAQEILKIIQWFQAKVDKPLQIDVFGVASFGPSKYIGQDIKLFSKSVQAICPMVYPSHYEPYKKHAVTPYETVYDSLMAIRGQFNGKPLPFKLIPYIELSNYRYKLSKKKKLDYIYAQIRAAENAKADGWYVWSPQNYYDNLFKVLETKKVK